jgi:hypothetical protein
MNSNQFPQELLAKAIIFFLRKTRNEEIVSPIFKVKNIEIEVHQFPEHSKFGISLGRYIIFGGHFSDVSLKHEIGHSFQSQKLKLLYLLLVGLPSISRNIFDRIFHRKWSASDRIIWYYSSYPEKQADELGEAKRIYV